MTHSPGTMGQLAPAIVPSAKPSGVTDEALLSVRDLSVDIRTPDGAGRVICDLNLQLMPGQIMGLVGESGSGKSMTALAVMGMLPAVAQVTSGSVTFEDRDLLQLDQPQLTSLRGRRIGMIFQDPLAYLNPRMTIRQQVAEALTVHGMPRRQAGRRAVELLELVEVRNAAERADSYPHEFSGGMRQRVMITMAIANNPRLLIADEPTTALDPTVQAGVLKLLGRIRDEYGTAILLITHDMGMVSEVCDAVSVMYGGHIVESGDCRDVLQSPSHPYSRGLIASVPRIDEEPGTRLRAIPGSPPELLNRPPGCPFAPRCEHAVDRCATAPMQLVDHARTIRALPHRDACIHPEPDPKRIRVTDRAELTSSDRPVVGPGRMRDGDPNCLASPREPILMAAGAHVTFGARRFPSRAGTQAVIDVDLSAHAGEMIGIIGESGSGKSTLARALLGLVPLAAGSVTVGGLAWDAASKQERLAMRRKVQMVFQDPYLSLNPRMSIREVLTEPLRVHRHLGATESRLRELMELVNLPGSFLDRFPYQLSGGQRQRVGIARALAVGPEIIVADEPVSALDVSVQAQIINLMADLRETTGIGFVLIAHDLGLVHHVCETTLVMNRGRVVERGATAPMFANPQDEYTKRLVAAARTSTPLG